MGQVFSGGTSRPITAEELQSILRMQQELTRLPVPTLQHRDNPHEYLFFAFFDGTGQDVNNPRLGPPTNVGLLYEQAFGLSKDTANRMGASYSRGIGTQSHALGRAVDGALALTWADGIEEAYRELAWQARAWVDADPQAKLSIAGMGYSRGGVQDAGFHRLVDRYGIADPTDLHFGRDHLGNITVESRQPPLVPPGQTAQVAVLLDPVATGFPENYDARLPPSVISALSFTAANEQRRLFPHQSINDPGFSPDGRALNLLAPGGHSNIGGGNAAAPGLEIAVGNTATDFLNLLRDVPLFQERAMPDDLPLFNVYQALGATAAWGAAMDHDGRRNLREELANCTYVDVCRGSEPANATLADAPEYRHHRTDPREQRQVQDLAEQAPHAHDTQSVVAAPQPIVFLQPTIEPTVPDAGPAAGRPSVRESPFFPRTATDDFLDAYCAASARGEYEACTALYERHAQLPHLQEMERWGRELHEAGQQRQLEEQRRLEEQRLQEELARPQWQEQQQQQERSRGRSH